MNKTRDQVRATAKSLGIDIPEDRLDQLTAAWEEALAEAEVVRQHPNPWPSPKAFDPAWSEKR